MDAIWWLKNAKPDLVFVGLQPAMLAKLGQLNFIDVPLAGTLLKSSDSFITVEATNMITDLKSPLTGKLVAINPQFAGKIAVQYTSDQWLYQVQR